MRLGSKSDAFHREGQTWLEILSTQTNISYIYVCITPMGQTFFLILWIKGFFSFICNFQWS